MTARAAELRSERIPFVHATVVRAQAPTSARPGDDAVVLADGAIEGFVGGQCAHESVRAAALSALEDGEPLLLRVLPAGEAGFPEAEGARVAVNPCLSGGALEIFLEPHLPAPVVAVVGETPIADALAAMAEPLGFAFDSYRSLGGRRPEGASAVIVCSLGRDEPESLRAALDAGVPFVGLVASRRRGEAVLAAAGLSQAERQRVHTPVGLDIGARSAAEIALSIMAQLVQELRRGGLGASGRPGTESPPPVRSVDPVCGMTVVVGPSTPHRRVDGADLWFCGAHCRDSYVG
jgi:xanthine dehydrogenase accessory factor